MGSNGNDHDYIQCGCHNPVWEALKDTLDPASYIASHPNAAQGPARDANGESLVFHDGIIYPLRDGNMDERVEALGIHAGPGTAARGGGRGSGRRGRGLALAARTAARCAAGAGQRDQGGHGPEGGGRVDPVPH